MLVAQGTDWAGCPAGSDSQWQMTVGDLNISVQHTYCLLKFHYFPAKMLRKKRIPYNLQSLYSSKFWVTPQNTSSFLHLRQSMSCEPFYQLFLFLPGQHTTFAALFHLPDQHVLHIQCSTITTLIIMGRTRQQKLPGTLCLYWEYAGRKCWIAHAVLPTCTAPRVLSLGVSPSSQPTEYMP